MGFRLKDADSPRRNRIVAEALAVAETLEARVLLSASLTRHILSSQSRGSETPTFIDLGPVSALESPAASPLTANAPYTPAEMDDAYGVNLISFNGTAGNGAGQTIAIVDAFNDPDIISDTATFSTQFSLPQFNAGGPTLKVLNQTGGTSLPASAAPGGWDVEESLDVEWAHSIAPQANIILFEATNNSSGNLYAAVSTAADYAGVSTISMSWGGGEYSGENSSDSIFTTPSGHQGVTFLVAAGDSGDIPGYPSESPNVISVGGTSLTLNSNGSYNTESAWSDGGGGVSAYESQPSYQVGKVNGLTTTRRATPDVSMDANPNTGVYVLDSFYVSGSYLEVGGTSLATPMWAALISIADQGRVLQGLGTLNGTTQTLPALYSASAANFHDITTGSNGQPATVGYDLATGIGSPVANLLIPALAGYNVASQLAFASQPPPNIAAGNVIPTITVDVEDSNGAITTSNSSNVTLSIYSGPSGATLAGTATVAASSGVATFSTLSLATPGAYTLEATDGSFTAAISNSFNVVAAPTVASTQVGDGSAQRSTISSISVTFSEPVILGGGAYTLYQEILNPDGSINTSAAPNNVTADMTATQSSNGTTLTLSVTPGGPLDRTGANDAGFFVNGIYQLVLNGSAITDSTGTANFDGGASTPAIFASDETQTGTSPYFHVLFGDLTGSGFVNSVDYRAFSQDYLAQTGDANYNAVLDYDGTGIINAISYNQFARDYLQSYSY